jgi:ABC-2 type transport system ATP-binding protein
VIDLTAVTARAAPLALASLSVSLGAGVHALLGRREDAVALVLDVIAGRLPVRSGSARLLGVPVDAAAARRGRAHVPIDAALPDSLRVDEALAMAAEIRREPPSDPASRLDVLGLSSLARRAVRTLTPGEVRGVALAEALTSTARVLLIDEPFLALDPRAVAAVARAVRARADAGACVVFATASVRDAIDLADDVLTFERGALVRRGASTEPLAAHVRGGVRLRVVADGARALLAMLAADPAVRAVDAEPGAVIVSGYDQVALASAVARAALAASASSDGPGVAIDAMRPELAPLDELRAAMAGDTAGAYRAAYERAHPTSATSGASEASAAPGRRGDAAAGTPGEAT